MLKEAAASSLSAHFYADTALLFVPAKVFMQPHDETHQEADPGKNLGHFSLLVTLTLDCSPTHSSHKGREQRGGWELQKGGSLLSAARAVKPHGE